MASLDTDRASPGRPRAPAAARAGRDAGPAATAVGVDRAAAHDRRRGVTHAAPPGRVTPPQPFAAVRVESFETVGGGDQQLWLALDPGDHRRAVRPIGG